MMTICCKLSHKVKQSNLYDHYTNKSRQIGINAFTVTSIPKEIQFKGTMSLLNICASKLQWLMKVLYDPLGWAVQYTHTFHKLQPWSLECICRMF